jgi:hypothetical protein
MVWLNPNPEHQVRFGFEHCSECSEPDPGQSKPRPSLSRPKRLRLCFWKAAPNRWPSGRAEPAQHLNDTLLINGVSLLSSHCSSDDEMDSCLDSLASRCSFLALNEILSPFLRMSSGLEAIESEVFEQKRVKLNCIYGISIVGSSLAVRQTNYSTCEYRSMPSIV